MTKIEKAKRDLEIACLERLTTELEGIRVSLYRDGAGVDLVFTAEDVQRAATRQLTDLRAKNKCDGFRTTLAGDALYCTLESDHEGQCLAADGQQWWRT